MRLLRTPRLVLAAVWLARRCGSLALRVRVVMIETVAAPVCPNCGSDDVKSHNRQYDCRTCRPLGYVWPVGTDIDRDDHWHHQCAKGHRWTDPRGASR